MSIMRQVLHAIGLTPTRDVVRAVNRVSRQKHPFVGNVLRELDLKRLPRGSSKR